MVARRLAIVVAGLSMTVGSGVAWAGQVGWRLDNLRRIGGFEVEAEGHPEVIESPAGKAIAFDGTGDSLFVRGRPLVGAAQFTIEAVFRPDGGAAAQRFFHIAETDPATGLDAQPSGTNDPNARFMFEVRVKDGDWYLDSFVRSAAGSRPLLFMDKPHPIGRWYAIAQSYDGKTYRAYVDGVLEGEAEIAFTPHGPGHVRIGARMNRVDYFKGAIARARFTDRALAPREMLTAPK